MGLYQTIKHAVPLEWKHAFYKRKTLPQHLAVRVSNRLKGQPPLPPGELIFLVAGDESSTHGPTWYGTDYNQRLVDWCRDNLRFCQFNVNTLSGKLPYEDGTFDFIYAYSVFTHLNEQLQFLDE